MQEEVVSLEETNSNKILNKLEAELAFLPIIINNREEINQVVYLEEIIQQLKVNNNNKINKINKVNKQAVYSEVIKIKINNNKIRVNNNKLNKVSNREINNKEIKMLHNNSNSNNKKFLIMKLKEKIFKGFLKTGKRN